MRVHTTNARAYHQCACVLRIYRIVDAGLSEFMFNPDQKDDVLEQDNSHCTTLEDASRVGQGEDPGETWREH